MSTKKAGAKTQTAPKKEAPKQEAPKEAPAKETQAPKAEAPKQEAPKAEAPKAPAKETQKPAAKTAATTELSSSAKMVIETIEAYAENMDGSVALDANDIQRNQRNLFTGLRGLLLLSGKDIQAAHTEVLKIIRKYRKTAFSERAAFRGFDVLRMSTQQRTSFERVLSLYITAADTKDKAALKKVVNVNDVAKSFQDPAIEQSLTTLFS